MLGQPQPNHHHQNSYPLGANGPLKIDIQTVLDRSFGDNSLVWLAPHVEMFQSKGMHKVTNRHVSMEQNWP